MVRRGRRSRSGANRGKEQAGRSAGTARRAAARVRLAHARRTAALAPPLAPRPTAKPGQAFQSLPPTAQLSAWMAHEPAASGGGRGAAAAAAAGGGASECEPPGGHAVGTEVRRGDGDGAAAEFEPPRLCPATLRLRPASLEAEHWARAAPLYAAVDRWGILVSAVVAVANVHSGMLHLESRRSHNILMGPFVGLLAYGAAAQLAMRLAPAAYLRRRHAHVAAQRVLRALFSAVRGLGLCRGWRERGRADAAGCLRCAGFPLCSRAGGARRGGTGSTGARAPRSTCPHHPAPPSTRRGRATSFSPASATGRCSWRLARPGWRRPSRRSGRWRPCL
jgi:hypothetical protein